MPSHTVCAVDDNVTVGSGFTVIVTSAVAVPQPGVWLLATVTVAVPLSVGVPLIVVPLQLTPSGRPVTLVIVAFVAVISMSTIASPAHTVWLSFVTVTSGSGFTVILTYAYAVPQLGVWSLLTVTVTLNVPYSVGVPLIVPVAPDESLLQLTPVGRPVTPSIVAWVAVISMAVIALFSHTV